MERMRIGGRLELKYAATSEPQGQINLNYLTVNSSKAVIYLSHLAADGASAPENPHYPFLAGSLWNVMAAGKAFLPESLKERKGLVLKNDSGVELDIK